MPPQASPSKIVGILTDCTPIQRAIVRAIKQPKVLVNLGDLVLLPLLYLGEVIRAVGMNGEYVQLELKSLTTGPISITLEMPWEWTNMTVPGRGPLVDRVPITTSWSRSSGLPRTITSRIHTYKTDQGEITAIAALNLDTTPGLDDDSVSVLDITSQPGVDLYRGKFVHIPPTFLGVITSIRCEGPHKALLVVQSATAGPPAVTLRANRNWTEVKEVPKKPLEWRTVSFAQAHLSTTRARNPRKTPN